MRYLSLIALLAACPSPSDTVWVDDNPNGTDTSAGTDTNGDYLLPAYHCGDITQDEAWGPDRLAHVVTCPVHVLRGATLDILPGTTVTFDEAASLTIADDDTPSSFKVHGTADEPVIIGSSNEGTLWEGILVNQRAVDVSLAYATLSGVGGGAVIDSSATLHLDHVTLDQSQSQGLVFHDAGLDDTSTALTISNLAGKPVHIDARFVHTLPTTDSDYTGNGFDWIDVRGDLISDSVSWMDLGVPYHIRGSVSVEGFASMPAVLTIAEGVTLLMGDSIGFEVGAMGDAGLIVDGTTANPVRFTAFGAATGGYWGGLHLGKYTLPELASVQHSLIEWGGATGSALTVDEIDVLLTDVTLRSSVESGFHFTGMAGFQAGSRDITSTGSRIPGTIAAARITSIPAATTSLTGNQLDMLHITGEVPVLESVTWPLLDVPYWVTSTVSVRGLADAPAILTLTPGSTYYFGYGAGMEIGAGAGAAGLLALGTPAQPIVLTAGMANEHGAWSGLLFGDHCEDTQTRLTYTTLAWSGGSGAALTLDKCNPVQLDDLTIYGSAGFAIRALAEYPDNINNLVATNNGFGSFICEGDTCWCKNGFQDPDTESDVDCGGVCGTCSTGQTCNENNDCFSGVCTAGVCD